MITKKHIDLLEDLLTQEFERAEKYHEKMHAERVYYTGDKYEYDPDMEECYNELVKREQLIADIIHHLTHENLEKEDQDNDC